MRSCGILIDILSTRNAEAARLQTEVLVLRRQVQVLERQVKRVRWSRVDRMVLAAFRNRIPRSGWAGLLVRPETVLGWHRSLVRRKWAAYRLRPRRGRPPVSDDCRQLIVRMALENPGWGYFRIRGELIKVGQIVSATTIRSVLLRAHIPPAGRRSRLSWKQFLAAHAETMVAADFFSVDTIFFKRLYVLIYVHLATRQVVLASCTSQPTRDWMAQQAKNLCWELEDQGLRLSHVIHDRDKKFAPGADMVMRAASARVIVTPLMAPRANAHAERWIGSCRRECLDRMLVVNQRHLDEILRAQATIRNSSLAIIVGVALPYVEFAVGTVMLVTPFGRLGSLAAALLGILFFAAAFSALVRGIDVSCGCAGSDSERVTPLTALRALGIASAGASLLTWLEPAFIGWMGLVVALMALLPATLPAARHWQQSRLWLQIQQREDSELLGLISEPVLPSGQVKAES